MPETILTVGRFGPINLTSTHFFPTVLRHQHEPADPAGGHHRLEAVLGVGLALFDPLRIAAPRTQRAPPHIPLIGRTGTQREILSCPCLTVLPGLTLGPDQHDLQTSAFMRSFCQVPSQK